jgi:hypothetical protein
VTAFLLASALLSALALSWLHLRPQGARSAVPFPSLQHLSGSPPRKRRALPLEEGWPWGLRLVSLLLALLGVWAARTGCGGDVRPVAVVDPSAASTAWTEARALSPTRLGFQGETPLAEGDAAGPLEVSLRACSDGKPACLLRAADSTGRPVVLVGALASSAWGPVLARRAGPFAFVRTAGVEEGPRAKASETTPLARIHLVATSAAARLWAAALETAAGEALPPGPGAAPPEVVVRGPEDAARLGSAPHLTLLALDETAPARADAPAVVAAPGTGLLLPDPLDLAAGTAGLGLHTPLAFSEDARFTEVLRLLSRTRAAGAPALAVAATPEALGTWAHEGSLLPLARAVLAAGLPGPTAVEAAPPGGTLPWKDASGQAAPVGLLDVFPGRYTRADGRVVLQLARAEGPTGTDVLSDEALQRLGGRPFAPGPPWRPQLPTALFCLALGAWLLGVLLTRRAWRAWPLALAVAVGLVLLVGDVHWARDVSARWSARLAVRPGPSAEALRAVARAAGVDARQAVEASALGCASPEAPVPCTPLGPVGWAENPAPGLRTLLFAPDTPRVDVLSVQAPREVALGRAAEVWTTLRVRRAEGLSLSLSLRSTSAAPAATELEVDGPDMVRTVHLALTPLSEGIAFLALQARVQGTKEAEDGRLLVLATRTRAERRLVLAPAPSWEARAVTRALAAGGAEVAGESLLGTRAVVARGLPARVPRDVLARPEALAGVGLLALVGFGQGDVDGPSATGLRRYLEGGGAVLLLDAPGAARALGFSANAAPAATPLQPLVGALLPLPPLPFVGYAPPGNLPPPLGGAVLARLGPPGDAAPPPWVVGRAFGQGRVAVVTAPDAWRLSPPGRGSALYTEVLSRLVGWLEAPVASRQGPVLEEGWGALRLQDGTGVRRVPLPAEGPVEGLLVDGVDVAAFNTSPRAALRAEAAGLHQPFLELEGLEGLSAVWGRLPPAPRWKQALALRRSETAFALLAGLLVLEALARRRYGGTGGSGSRAKRAASSPETGGTTSGDGDSQRPSVTAAARAAALKAAASRAA